MNYVIIYFSRFGNGKKLVEHLAVKLKARGEVKVSRLEEANPAAMPQAGIYVFSAPAEAFSIQRDMRAFMKKLTGMEGKKYGIINTHGMKKNRLAKMETLLSKKGMVKAAELEFQVTGDYKNGNGLPAGWEKKLDEFALKL
jgi:flavodoxin